MVVFAVCLPEISMSSFEMSEFNMQGIQTTCKYEKILSTVAHLESVDSQ